MVWKKISSLFRRVPGDLLNLQGQMQSRLSSRIQKKFPRWLDENSKLNAGDPITVNHLTEYLLIREARDLPEVICLGRDDSPESQCYLGKHTISLALEQVFRETLKKTENRKPNHVEDDELLSLAFLKAAEGDGLTLGDGIVPDAGRLAASFFRARALRWIETESALDRLCSLPSRPELADALNVEGLEVWLLMRRSVFSGHAGIEEWQSDLSDARKLLEQARKAQPDHPRDAIRQLLLARICHWQNEFKDGCRYFDDFLKTNNDSKVRSEVARWRLIQHDKPTLELLSDLWAIETWREKMTDLAAQFDEEDLDSCRGENIWELVKQARRQTEDLCLSACEKHPNSATTQVVHAEMHSLTADLGFLDGPFKKAEALKSLDAAITLAPEHPTLLIQRARVKLVEGDTGQLVAPSSDSAETAFDDLVLAVKLGHTGATLTAAGLALDRAAALTDRDSKQLWLEKSIALFEDLVKEDLSFDAVRGACGAYLASDRPERALSIAEAALDKDPENAELIIFTAHLCLDLGQPKKAAEFVDQALNLDPENPDAMMLAARSRFDESMDDTD